jgi:hypothetical protein
MLLGDSSQRAALALVLSCAWMNPGMAQTAPSQVTAAQVAEYKATAMSGCRDAGKNRGDADAKVSAFCACLIGMLEKNLTLSEWQKLYLYSRDQQSQEELQVLQPHMKTVAVCAQP